MRDCPQCAAPVDGPTCPSCGYADSPTAKASRPVDPLRYLCHHEERGLRCASVGTFSPNTQGDSKGGPHPGPWYCWQHARHVHGGQPDGGRVRNVEALARIKRQLGPKRLDAEAIAERLAIQAEAL